MNIGDKVLINIEKLERSSWDGLVIGTNNTGKDYRKYILDNVDKEYKIKEINDEDQKDADVVLDDDFLSDTYFYFDELIKG